MTIRKTIRAIDSSPFLFFMDSKNSGWFSRVSTFFNNLAVDSGNKKWEPEGPPRICPPSQAITADGRPLSKISVATFSSSCLIRA